MLVRWLRGVNEVTELRVRRREFGIRNATHAPNSISDLGFGISDFPPTHTGRTADHADGRRSISIRGNFQRQRQHLATAAVRRGSGRSTDAVGAVSFLD